MKTENSQFKFTDSGNGFGNLDDLKLEIGEFNQCILLTGEKLKLSENLIEGFQKFNIKKIPQLVLKNPNLNFKNLNLRGGFVAGDLERYLNG